MTREAPAPFGIATGAQCLIVTVHRFRVQRSGLGKKLEFQPSKYSIYSCLPREMRSLFLWDGWNFRLPHRGVGPTGRRLDLDQN